MKQEVTENQGAELKLLGEHLAVELSAEEINSVSGAIWVKTIETDGPWGPNPFCPCGDRQFIN
jgi:hypothetical protein